MRDNRQRIIPWKDPQAASAMLLALAAAYNDVAPGLPPPVLCERPKAFLPRVAVPREVPDAPMHLAKPSHQARSLVFRVRGLTLFASRRSPGPGPGSAQRRAVHFRSQPDPR